MLHALISFSTFVSSAFKTLYIFAFWDFSSYFSTVEQLARLVMYVNLQQINFTGKIE